MNERIISSPNDLVATINYVTAALRDGRLEALSESSGMDTFWDVTTWNGVAGDWPDYFLVWYSDRATQRRVVFYCESYHGSGGGLLFEDTYTNREKTSRFLRYIIFIIIGLSVIAVLTKCLTRRSSATPMSVTTAASAPVAPATGVAHL